MGPTGQAEPADQLLQAVPANRRTWNVQRLFWFLWRDPAAELSLRTCSLCGTAGLLRHDRTRKPAYYAFKGFTAETTPPVASITGGPSQGSFTKDPTPTFSFAQTRPARLSPAAIDSAPFVACASPYTRRRRAPERRPHLLRQRDRRPRQRERPSFRGRSRSRPRRPRRRSTRAPRGRPTTRPPPSSFPRRSHARAFGASSTPPHLWPVTRRTPSRT